MTAPPAGGWFDSHCHLQMCKEPAEAVVERARAAGVGPLLCAATDLASSREIAGWKLDGVYVAVGIHPNDAGGWDDDSAAEIESLLARESVVAVGETGLDFYRDAVDPPRQIAAFEAQLDVALRHDKAVVIHTRSSLDKTLEILESRTRLPRLVFHCWSGSAAEVGRAVATGGYISFAGNVSYNSASDLRAAAAVVPPDRLLVETDSPFLAPVPHRGRDNEPAYVVAVGAAVAAARGEDAGAIAALTSANAKRLFGL